MVDRSQFIGRLAGATQIIFAALLAGVSAFHFEPSFVPRSTVVLVVFALPGIVGLIGTRARRPALLIAAGLTSFVGAFIAFSGVTLIFLMPAALFLAGAFRLAWRGPGRRGDGWLGSLAQLGFAAAIVALLIGAGASALLITDSGCWTAFQTPIGVRIELAPWSTGEMEVSSGATVGGCATGLISARGAGLGALLGSAAVGLAGLAARRRDRVSDGPTGGLVAR